MMAVVGIYDFSHKNSCAYLKQEMQDKLIEHKCYIQENGQDMPEIKNWKWGQD